MIEDSQELHRRVTTGSRDATAQEEAGDRAFSEHDKKGWDAWNAIKKEFENQISDARSSSLNGDGERSNSLNGINSEGSDRSWSSLHTPFKRRFQTAMIAWHLSAFVFLPVIAIYALSNPLLWFLSVPYFIYYMFDRAPGNGGVVYRRSDWFRSLSIWSYLCDYFPIALHKTADLQPTFTRKSASSKELEGKKNSRWKKMLGIFRYSSKNSEFEVTGPRYIFGYHPHGIGAIGSFGVFGTEGRRWSQIFPGIPVSLMTLVTQFHVPLYRDYLMALGISAVSKKNTLKVLEKDNSICIVVGGARESLASSIGHVDLILNRRKGFIRLALEAGNVCLTPVFAFGETDLYNIVQTSEDSFSRKVQLWLKQNYGFTVPLFYARGMFNYDFGFLPYRRAINVVIGKPIFVKEKIPNPSEEELDYYHQRYMQELKKLYYDNRDRFGYSDKEINIVG
ncbi:hypothetical protein HG535_0A06120 [Zygotorulaspora mrakii]|uniref:Diacylglycerol O-acyltransferase n=1 Tax=Zygotorulaspora mrakii TaxID=42260 RepID=A0A7H9AW93_ZYGMR|nr:uncharacterized protein HG535_0A06120 [Zygotorulaspora mrakii]QLG70670.1 hypothetical protein HG535_0A06120 [Zygotorulaspora mrakii]